MCYRDIISSGDSIADCYADDKQRSVCRCSVSLESGLTRLIQYTAINNGFLLYHIQTRHWEYFLQFTDTALRTSISRGCYELKREDRK